MKLIALAILFEFVLAVITGKFLALVARGLTDVESAIKTVSETSAPF